LTKILTRATLPTSQTEEAPMKFYFNPLSSYSQKALIAMYEKGFQFEPQIVNVFDPAGRAEYEKINLFCKVPMLVLNDGHKIPESSIIIEYVDTHSDKGPRLIPTDKDLGRQTRFFDRMGDLYVNDPMATIFFDGRKPEGEREPKRVAAAKATLDKSFAAMDKHLEKGPWIMGDQFTMADCAAAPALAYCQKLHPFDKYKNLTAYVNRLKERPSFARVLKEAAPHFAQMGM
jgi:glutathione S-transferase